MAGPAVITGRGDDDGAVDGRVFFGGGPGLTVLDASDGTVVATYQEPGDARVVPEHRMLLGQRGAWSATDGKKMWSAPNFLGGVLMGGTVVGNEYDPKTKKGSLVGLDPREGEERWQHKDLYAFVSTSRTAPDSPLIAKVRGEGAKLLRVDGPTRPGPHPAGEVPPVDPLPRQPRLRRVRRQPVGPRYRQRAREAAPLHDRTGAVRRRLTATALYYAKHPAGSAHIVASTPT
ncbi:hypothetical protein ACFUJY_30345 [Streptomyces sp. NPDC057249]|uniref:hypothetical protein n=1 Tax=Streptomyces sp. NPDC057249 TaxID=3346067 RepID=UPI003624BDB0